VLQTRSTVTVRVPAKVNIGLRIGPRRADGFHSLNTVYHAVSLYDTVTARRSDTMHLSLTGPESAGLAADHTNLAWRAAELLAAHRGIPNLRVELQVDKQIPVAAGLAGGSADAAGAMLACDELWGLGLDLRELSDLAAQLGSDVPFAVHGGTMLGSGRGESIQPVPVAGNWTWVLAIATGSLSTPAVYAELDRQRALAPRAAMVNDPALDGPASDANAAVLAALANGDAAGTGGAVNDLQPAALALAPGLQDTLRVGREAGARVAMVSGSGPTCVFLADDAGAAEQIANRLRALPGCREALIVRGNVPVLRASLAEPGPR
jgi:4-diphosphocytidyl-2-C-methyl-D-erythritol kinase